MFQIQVIECRPKHRQKIFFFHFSFRVNIYVFYLLNKEFILQQ
jgi:hypothetical protein